MEKPEKMLLMMEKVMKERMRFQVNLESMMNLLETYRIDDKEQRVACLPISGSYERRLDYRQLAEKYFDSVLRICIQC